MDRNIIFVIIVFWVTMSAYVMHWHYKRGDLSLGTVLLALFIGPVLALIIRDNEHEIKKHHYIEENENDRHRRWFRTMGEINRQRTPTWFRTIPPPPPISRVERAITERDDAIRSAIERIDKNKLKDFKFLRTNVKD